MHVEQETIPLQALHFTQKLIFVSSQTDINTLACCCCCSCLMCRDIYAAFHDQLSQHIQGVRYHKAGANAVRTNRRLHVAFSNFHRKCILVKQFTPRNFKALIPSCEKLRLKSLPESMADVMFARIGPVVPSPERHSERRTHSVESRRLCRPLAVLTKRRRHGPNSRKLNWLSTET